MRLKYLKILFLFLVGYVLFAQQNDPWESISKRPIPNGGPPLSEFYHPPTSISEQMKFKPSNTEYKIVEDGYRVTSKGQDNDKGGFIVIQTTRDGQIAFLKGMADIIIPRLRYYAGLAEQNGDYERKSKIENDITIARNMLQAAEQGDEEKLNVLAQQCSPIILGLVDTIKNMPAKRPKGADRFYFQLPQSWYDGDPAGIPHIRALPNPPSGESGAKSSGGGTSTDSSEVMYRSPTTVYLQVVHHKDDCGDQMWTETDVVYNLTVDGNTYTTGQLSQDDNDFDCDVEFAVYGSGSSCSIQLDAWDTDGGWTGDDHIDLRWGSGYTPTITYNYSTKLWSGDATVPYTRGDDGDDWAKCWFSIASSYDDDEGQRNTSWHYSESNYRSGCMWGGSSLTYAPVLQNNGGNRYEDCQTYNNQYYKFYVQSGDYFCVSTDPFQGGGITEENIDLYLYDPDNSLRASSTNSGTGADQVCFTADKTGWWYVRTYTPSGYQTWFDIWFSNQLQNDYNVVGVGPVSSPWSDRGYLVYRYSDGSDVSYNYEDTEDWYKLYLAASSGRRITVTMTPQSGSRDFDLYVYYPSGSLLGSSLNWGDATETVSGNASGAGWYYFKVDYWSGDGGYYVFSIDTACIDYSGTFKSQSITPPPSVCEYQWSRVIYNQTLNNGSITLKILDGSGTPISGYTHSSSSDGNIIWDLSGLSTEDYPSIRLEADFTTCGGPYPELHNWEVKWSQYGTGSQAIWVGGVSTAWSNSNNWYCNMPPDATKDVVISNVYIDTYMPTVDITTAVCRDITVGSTTTLTISGTNYLTCRSVTIEGEGEIVFSGSGSMDVSGNWTNNGAFTAGTGTVTFIGSATKDIQGSTPTKFYNLITTGGTTRINLSTSVLNNFTNGAIFQQQGNELDISGNFTNNGTFTAGTNGITLFNGSSDQSISGSVQPQFYYLYLNKSGSHLILNRNISVESIEDFSQPTASVMRLNGHMVDYGP